jgi:hypothetical protein
MDRLVYRENRNATSCYFESDDDDDDDADGDSLSNPSHKYLVLVHELEAFQFLQQELRVISYKNT